jgi:hypothetical protein
MEVRSNEQLRLELKTANLQLESALELLTSPQRQEIRTLVGTLRFFDFHENISSKKITKSKTTKNLSFSMKFFQNLSSF